MPGCSREGTAMGSAIILLLQGPNTPLPLQPQTTSFHVHLRTSQFKCLRRALRAHFAHWMITATSSGLETSPPRGRGCTGLSGSASLCPPEAEPGARSRSPGTSQTHPSTRARAHAQVCASADRGITKTRWESGRRPRTDPVCS